MSLSAEELSQKRQDILRKVRGLIAKADSTPEPAEAALFRDKADELMERFAIDMWMVEAASENSAARVPVGRMLSIDWLYGHPFSNEVWTLFTATAWHTRCVVASWKWHDGKIGVVGLEADIDYFDLTFTYLLAEMGRRLLPSVDPEQSAEWNAWALRTRHLGWPEIAWELSNAGMLAWPDGFENWKYDRIAGYNLKAAQTWRRKARKLYRDHCRKNGLEPESSKQPATSAKSYAMGWSQEIRRRMNSRDKSSIDDHKGTGAEVALRDIRTVVREAVERIYPQPHYDPPPASETTNRRPSRAVVYKEPPFDPEAYSRGSKDAKKVDIGGNQNRRVDNKPQELKR